jgi:hypothetical protein
MKVYLLTEAQANSLRNVEFIVDNLFGPIQDADGNWIITRQEVSQCKIGWVKQLPQIDYKPYIPPDDVFIL